MYNNTHYTHELHAALHHAHPCTHHFVLQTASHTIISIPHRNKERNARHTLIPAVLEATDNTAHTM